MTRKEAMDIIKCLAWYTRPDEEDVEQAIKTIEQEPTTKNDLPHCKCTDEEIAKSFIGDVEAVKDQLPTTKNNLGVDLISRADALDCVNWGYSFSDIYKKINELPSVTPQEPKTGHWIKHDNGVWWECSKCHAERAYGNEYCPDCGSHNGDIAKMVESQESEE